MMVQPADEPNERQHILTQVYEGMTVYDPQGETIGTVRHVYLGAVTEEEEARGLGPATAPDPERSEHTIIGDFIETISPQEKLPEPVRQRFLRQGFIRISTSGLMTSDRYATPDQIAHVSGDDLTLRVPREALLIR
jgi:hypothetical protein